MPSLLVPGVTILIVALIMLFETGLSARHERWLRAQDAREPADDVYEAMRWIYPTCFAVMAVEGALDGLPAQPWWLTGIGVFAGAKAIKYWAIAALGRRWTFRVLVIPGEPLVTAGPYRYLRHPNYVGVIGELLGMSLMMGAWASGPIVLLTFWMFLRRRIAVEERMLGRRPSIQRGGTV